MVVQQFIGNVDHILMLLLVIFTKSQLGFYIKFSPAVAQVEIFYLGQNLQLVRQNIR